MVRAMKATKRIAGSLAPLVIGFALLASCGSSPEESPEPVGEGSGPEEVAEPADGAAEAGDAADAAGQDATDGESDAWDVNGETEAADASGEADAEAPDAAPVKDRFARGAGMSDEDLARFHTTMEIEIDGEPAGTMVFELWSDEAPITVRNHLRLVDTGFYDGVGFHRIMRDFMVQGGDPTGTGTGNSPYGTIQAEFSRDPERSHEYGVLSMARTPAPNSASCQFFIVCDNENARQLDGEYATFGRLTQGVDTLEAIASVPVGRSPRGEPSVPRAEVVIVDAEVVEGEAPGGEEITRPE